MIAEPGGSWDASQTLFYSLRVVEWWWWWGDSRSTAARAAANRRWGKVRRLSAQECVCLDLGSSSTQQRRPITIWRVVGEKKKTTTKEKKITVMICKAGGWEVLRPVWLLPGVSSCFDSPLAKTFTHGRLFFVPPFFYCHVYLQKKTLTHKDEMNTRH